jgi:hypothetical protein
MKIDNLLTPQFELSSIEVKKVHFCEVQKQFLKLFHFF